MKALVIAGLIALTMTAYAGEKGNGGVSVVCRSEQGEILSAELLDIFEGRNISRRLYPSNEKSVDTIILNARNRISSYPSLLAKIDKELDLVNQNWVLISEGIELMSTDDAYPRITKKGCKFEQVANYLDTGEVLVAQDIYDHFNNVSKAALVLHEAIYAYRRKALMEESSVNTRRFVAHIMAENADENMIDRLVADSIFRPTKKRPCGLEGSINDRIEKCLYMQQDNPFGLVLVTRTKELREVWYDQTNQLLISDRLPPLTDFETSKKICSKAFVEMGNLPGITWRLPTIQEYTRMSQAYVQVLPNMVGVNVTYWFWTSSQRGRTVFTFNGADGTISGNIFLNSATGSVRCVSTLE
jgi:hypothetical protein